MLKRHLLLCALLALPVAALASKDEIRAKTDACEKKLPDGPACYWLADAYRLGQQGLKANLKKAYGYYEQACQAGTTRVTAACAAQGMALRSGEGVRRDPAAAFKVLLNACLGGIAESCTATAEDMAQGLVKDRGIKDALKYFDDGCRRGDVQGCIKGAALYADGKATPTRELTPQDFLGRGCQLDDRESCIRMTRSGPVESVPVIYFTRACRMDDLPSCSTLARIYEEGRMTVGSDLVAALLYDKACAGGQTDDCARATVARNRGKPGPWRIDPSLSLGQQFMLAEHYLYEGDASIGIQELDRLAYREEDANAAFLLGRLYQLGYGSLLTTDAQKAATLYGIAARKGHVEASWEFGLARWKEYEQGNHRSYDAASTFLKRAAAAGHEEAIAFLDAINQQQQATWRARQTQFEQRQQKLVADYKASVAAEQQRDLDTVRRAWQQVAERQSKADGERVCATIYQGTRMYQDCMSKERFEKNYTPWGRK